MYLKGNKTLSSPWLINDACNSCNMLHSLLEQYQIHDCICLIVFREFIFK